VEADRILNICGAQEFNEDLLRSDRILYVESDPAVDKSRSTSERTTIDYLRGIMPRSLFGENVGSKSFPVPTHGFKWLPTRHRL